MNFSAWFLLILMLLVMIGFILDAIENSKIASMSPDERKLYLEKKESSLRKKRNEKINSEMICPHCHSVGKTWTKEVIKKKGVSGGKATAAVLTGGLSLLAVGLSRKEGTTQAHCVNCRNTWFF